MPSNSNLIKNIKPNIFYVNFDFKLGYLSLLMNLTDKKGSNSMKMVVLCFWSRCQFVVTC